MTEAATRMQTGHSVDEIRAFWNGQAERYGADLKATMYDPLAKELEVAALQQHLDRKVPALEVGCGNGVNLLQMTEWFEAPLTGVDYSDRMIAVANGLAKERSPRVPLKFAVASVLEDLRHLGMFPQIFTVRCLINLPSRDDQARALANLAAILPPGGEIVMIEHFEEGQERINELRQSVGLPAISYKWHNLYMRESDVLARLPEQLEHVETDRFASLYYLISRVFNAYVTPADKDPDYLAEINKLSCRLPAVGDFAPLKLMRFRKRK